MFERLKRKAMVGSLNMLIMGVLTFVILAVVAGVGLSITSDAKDDMVTGSAAYNATTNAEAGIGKITAKTGLIATALVFVVILGLILGIVAFTQLRGK